MLDPRIVPITVNNFVGWVSAADTARMMCFDQSARNPTHAPRSNLLAHTVRNVGLRAGHRRAGTSRIVAALTQPTLFLGASPRATPDRPRTPRERVARRLRRASAMTQHKVASWRVLGRRCASRRGTRDCPMEIACHLRGRCQLRKNRRACAERPNGRRDESRSSNGGNASDLALARCKCQ